MGPVHGAIVQIQKVRTTQFAQEGGVQARPDVCLGPVDVRDDLTRVLAEWRDIFRAGLERMQYDGRLDASADSARLAHMLMAAYQGGSLLARIARNVAPLRDAPYAAVEHLRAYTTSDDIA
ncbi:LmrA/YxaF family transcription factor [Streptomyces sp. 6N106]|uniref:LmrA/YxaF family transcription factor n=1 Tax=Streptomyces sp. 6N106 TaxID=3457418 RepID=UPI003FD4C1BF